MIFLSLKYICKISSYYTHVLDISLSHMSSNTIPFSKNDNLGDAPIIIKDAYI